MYIPSNYQKTYLCVLVKEEFDQLQATSSSSNSKQNKKKKISKKFKKPKPVQASSLQTTDQPVTAKSNNPSR